MKKRGIICLALLLVLSSAYMAVSANEAIDKSVKEIFDDLSNGKGPLLYTLPEDAAISLDVNISSYPVSWEPIAGVHSYWMGVTAVMKNGYFSEYARLAEGWMGASYVKNGEGEEFFMTNIIHDSIQLDGDATEVDIAPQIKMLTEWNSDDTPIACYLIVLVIPESGEPMYQAIPIPLA